MHNSLTSYDMRDLSWSIFLTLTLFAAVMLLPDIALADGDEPISDTLCAIISWLRGTTGRAIATIAIIIVGVGALMGKVSWGMAIIVAIGVAIVFGAPQIVEILGGGTGGCTD